MQSTAANENKKPQADRVAEVELVYRNKTKASERAEIRTSWEAYNALLKTWNMDKIELQEQFRILLLDRKSACIGIATISTGGITACIVDLRLAFALALKARATSIIIAHNHPSGNTAVSQADKELTAKFCAAGKILDIPVLDHIIVTNESYTSMCDQGICNDNLQTFSTTSRTERVTNEGDKMSEENKEKKKPELYIFKRDAEGKTINAGAAFRQAKGNGLNIVIGKDRYEAYPPKVTLSVNK